MNLTFPHTVPSESIALPIATLLLAATIFAIDSTTNLEIAVAVLYVVVILMSVRFCGRRGVVLVGAGCAALTFLSYSVTRSGNLETGLINSVISLIAMSLTTFLALKIESVRASTRALAEADQLRDALIGSVSHELRTPLASILGGVSVLAETPTVANDARLTSLTAGIRDEAMRLNNDIQNLLDAARITSKGLRSRHDWTDPSDIVDAAVKRIGARYPRHKIDLNLAPDLPLIEVDPVLIEQALGQIIANAAKYSPGESAIHVTAVVENRQLIIAVRDEGLGLTPDERHRLPERFFRGKRHIGKISGSGLGMWIAHIFVTSNGGKIEALSDGEDRGTTMRILLPISPHADETGSGTEAD